MCRTTILMLVVPAVCTLLRGSRSLQWGSFSETGSLSSSSKWATPAPVPAGENQTKPQSAWVWSSVLPPPRAGNSFWEGVRTHTKPFLSPAAETGVWSDKSDVAQASVWSDKSDVAQASVWSDKSDVTANSNNDEARCGGKDNGDCDCAGGQVRYGCMSEDNWNWWWVDAPDVIEQFTNYENAPDQPFSCEDAIQKSTTLADNCKEGVTRQCRCKPKAAEEPPVSEEMPLTGRTQLERTEGNCSCKTQCAVFDGQNRNRFQLWAAGFTYSNENLLESDGGYSTIDMFQGMSGVAVIKHATTSYIYNSCYVDVLEPGCTKTGGDVKHNFQMLTASTWFDQFFTFKGLKELGKQFGKQNLQNKLVSLANNRAPWGLCVYPKLAGFESKSKEEKYKYISDKIFDSNNVYPTYPTWKSFYFDRTSTSSPPPLDTPTMQYAQINGITQGVLGYDSRTNYDNNRDVMPFGVRKEENLFGVICPVQIEIDQTSPYSGILKYRLPDSNGKLQGMKGFMRLSSYGARIGLPRSEQPITWVKDEEFQPLLNPTVELKIPREGHSSANMVFRHSWEGQVEHFIEKTINLAARPGPDDALRAFLSTAVSNGNFDTESLRFKDLVNPGIVVDSVGESVEGKKYCEGADENSEDNGKKICKDQFYSRTTLWKEFADKIISIKRKDIPWQVFTSAAEIKTIMSDPNLVDEISAVTVQRAKVFDRKRTDVPGFSSLDPHYNPLLEGDVSGSRNFFSDPLSTSISPVFNPGLTNSLPRLVYPAKVKTTVGTATADILGVSELASIDIDGNVYGEDLYFPKSLTIESRIDTSSDFKNAGFTNNKDTAGFLSDLENIKEGTAVYDLKAENYDSMTKSSLTSEINYLKFGACVTTDNPPLGSADAAEKTAYDAAMAGCLQIDLLALRGSGIEGVEMRRQGECARADTKTGRSSGSCRWVPRYNPNAGNGIFGPNTGAVEDSKLMKIGTIYTTGACMARSKFADEQLFFKRERAEDDWEMIAAKFGG